MVSNEMMQMKIDTAFKRHFQKDDFDHLRLDTAAHPLLERNRSDTILPYLFIKFNQHPGMKHVIPTGHKRKDGAAAKESVLFKEGDSGTLTGCRNSSTRRQGGRLPGARAVARSRSGGSPLRDLRQQGPAYSGEAFAGFVRQISSSSLPAEQKVLQQRTVLDIPRLQVEAGEISALVGPAGSGKGALLDLLLGRTQPTAGTVRVAGLDPRADPGELHRRVGVLFYEDGLYLREGQGLDF
jgi:ABC-type multidrug transport system fused ATPase/permease subunit